MIRSQKVPFTVSDPFCSLGRLQHSPGPARLLMTPVQRVADTWQGLGKEGREAHREGGHLQAGSQDSHSHVAQLAAAGTGAKLVWGSWSRPKAPSKEKNTNLWK